MPVAAIAMIPAPEYCQKGIAAIAATAMQLHTGVCRVGDTRDRNLDPGSWLSRDMPKRRRIVAARVDRQQTKLASMICAGPQAFFTATTRWGIATSVPSRNTPPMMKAPTTEYSTALGAARRGSLVSSDSVEAVSKP